MYMDNRLFLNEFDYCDIYTHIIVVVIIVIIAVVVIIITLRNVKSRSPALW